MKEMPLPAAESQPEIEFKEVKPEFKTPEIPKISLSFMTKKEVPKKQSAFARLGNLKSVAKPIEVKKLSIFQ